MYNNEERKERRAEKKEEKSARKFLKIVHNTDAGKKYSAKKMKRIASKLSSKSRPLADEFIRQETSKEERSPSEYKSRTYTKGPNSESRALARAYRKDKREANKPQSTKTEGVPFEPPRMLTSEEVWKRPTLGGMKRDYLNQPRKEARAAAAAGRAFRKGKMG